MTERPLRGGLTLVEMMVTIAITLLLLLVLMRALQYLGDVSRSGRGQIELAGSLRAALHRFDADMAMLSVQPRSPGDSANGRGYLEIGEGNMRDFGHAASTLQGDIDDYIAFTVVSHDQPFFGRYNGEVIQSQVAEIMWATSKLSGPHTPGDPRVTLLRRVLLVRPDLGTVYSPPAGSTPGSPPVTAAQFLLYNDVSIRTDRDNLIANSLTDLGVRRRRGFHAGTSPIVAAVPARVGEEVGETLVLTNVLAADIRVFDPYVPLGIVQGESVAPSDPGYLGSPLAGDRGGFVDLGHSLDPRTRAFSETRRPSQLLASQPPFPTGMFAGPPEFKAFLGTYTSYDTWSRASEHNGRDDDGDLLVDEGSDGLDNWIQGGSSGNGVVDDVEERETLPPYPFPLRGVKLTVRVFDPATNQLRQASTTADFTP